MPSLSVSPLLKYPSIGGPGVPEILALIGKHRNAENSKIVFTAQLFYNYLIRGPDAHEKNCSLLLTEEGPFLSPLYDCASAFPYDLENGKWKPAMRIGDCNAFGELAMDDLKKYSELAGLPPDLCENLLFNLVQGIADHCAEVFERLGDCVVGDLRERMLPQLMGSAQAALSLE